MLVKTLRVGQALQIGEAAAVKVLDKKGGQYVRLGIATALAPIRLLPDGIIPARFAVGIKPEGGDATVELLHATG